MLKRIKATVYAGVRAPRKIVGWRNTARAE
jgi:hypothetical protein